MFIGDAPPSRVVEALDYLKQNGPRPVTRMKALGYRNACTVLRRFRLIEMTLTREYRLTEGLHIGRTSVEVLWEETKKEPTLAKVVDLLTRRPSSSVAAVGRFVAEQYGLKWKAASQRRVGNSLRKWGAWLVQGEQIGGIPDPPGRSKTQGDLKEPMLFDFGSDGEQG